MGSFRPHSIWLLMAAVVLLMACAVIGIWHPPLNRWERPIVGTWVSRSFGKTATWEFQRRRTLLIVGQK
jgi:hypothetical protein